MFSKLIVLISRKQRHLLIIGYAHTHFEVPVCFLVLVILAQNVKLLFRKPTNASVSVKRLHMRNTEKW